MLVITLIVVAVVYHLPNSYNSSMLEYLVYVILLILLVTYTIIAGDFNKLNSKPISRFIGVLCSIPIYSYHLLVCDRKTIIMKPPSGTN